MFEESNFVATFCSDLKLFKQKKILVLIPHPDDETFGCGGTLLLIKDEVIIDFLVVTDGGKADEKVLPEDRYNELNKVAKYLKVRNTFFLNIPDREACLNFYRIQQNILDIIETNGYDIVFSPSIFEYHPDHKVVSRISINLFIENKIKELFFYEITLPQPISNFAVDITNTISEKRLLISLYPSQLALNNYEEYIISINKARCLTLPNHVKYTEFFYRVITNEDLGKYSLFNLLKIEQIENYLERDKLISVIVRTFNRPLLLKEALQSIYVQSYRNFEVIVVNDGGEDVREITDFFSNNLDKLIYLNLKNNAGRAKAANEGLEKSSGDFIIFLDDDDLFYPDALKVLSKNIKGNVACYGKTLCVEIDQGQENIITTLGKNFIFEELFFRNFIPLISIMFKKDILEKLNGFDTSFEIFEDWDLIFRVAKLGQINFVDEFVAKYRTFESSTLTFKGGEDFHFKWINHFYNKHKDFFTPKLVDSFLKQYYSKDDKIIELKKMIAERDKLLAEKESLLNEILSSKAWKFITFYRKIISHLRR